MIRQATLGGGALVLAACQTLAAGEGASLATLEPAAVGLAREDLARAMGLGRVELGGGDPTVDSQIVVLPPRVTPREGNSLATPRVFTIMLTETACVLKEQDGDLEVALPRSACRAT